MTKKTKDLLLAIGLLLIGYFFGDTVARINNNPLGIKIDSENILQQQDVFRDKKNATVNERSAEKEVKGVDISEKNGDLMEGVVKYIIDGDTIILTNGEKVRYVGMDTPERGQCWYRQAKEFNRKLVGGKKVRLERDKSNRDRYQRLLRYVYVQNSPEEKEIFVNLELVKAGLARAKEYKPDTKYASILEQAESYAKINKIGLWGGCEE